MYILDLDKINAFILGDSSERTHDTEITETYEPDESFEETDDGILIKRNTTASLNLVGRTIREVKGSDDNGKFTVKYDLIKHFITMLGDDGFDLKTMTIGQNMIFYTMLSYGLIREIEG